MFFFISYANSHDAVNNVCHKQMKVPFFSASMYLYANAVCDSNAVAVAVPEVGGSLKR